MTQSQSIEQNIKHYELCLLRANKICPKDNIEVLSKKLTINAYKRELKNLKLNLSYTI